jgi:hypothetical protein
MHPIVERCAGLDVHQATVEYLAAHPTGYRYSAFCARYRAWRATQRLSMRQVRPPLRQSPAAWL